MRTWSGSCRWVVNFDWPGRRRSSQGWMSASVRGRRGGQPSTTQPIAGPWLSPQVVKRNRWPKLLWLTRSVPAVGRGRGRSGLDDREVRRGRILQADEVVAAVDKVHLSGHARGQVRQQVDTGAAVLLDRDVALHRRIQLVPAEDVAEVADPRGGEGLDRPGADRVYP